MKTDQEDLLHKALGGRLSPKETAEWDALVNSDPSWAERFDAERAFDQLLQKLPDVPVSSNFTHRTVQAAIGSGRNSGELHLARRPGPWRFWIRIALGGATACLAGFLIFQQQQFHARKELVESLRSVSEVASLPTDSEDLANSADLEVWQNFDAIYRLNQMPRQDEVDSDLLAALEK